MIDGKGFWPASKNNLRAYDNIGQKDDYTTVCLLDYNYFNNYYKIVPLDLNKQKALDADSKSIQQINFTGDLEQNENTTMFFIVKQAKETILDFSQGTVRVL